jgi:hypothetical protein
LDSDLVHQLGFTKAEVQGKVILREVAAAAAYFFNLPSPVCDDHNPGAYPIPIGTRSLEFDLDPSLQITAVIPQ